MGYYAYGGKLLADLSGSELTEQRGRVAGGEVLRFIKSFKIEEKTGGSGW